MFPVGQSKTTDPGAVPCLPTLSEEEQARLAKQDTRLVPEFRANKFQSESKKHWDLFYKRNADRFFKDRHWTTREFEELTGESAGGESKRILFEVGCGAGNFVFPLLDDSQFFIYACDFSPRAVQLVKENPLYDEEKIKAFQCDITSTDQLAEGLGGDKPNVLSMVFVLSAIKPERFSETFSNLFGVLADGGVVLFRDYAVNDMAMVRFAPGTKIADRHYLRQDGTTSYFFSLSEVRGLAEAAGFSIKQLEYVHRRTVNKKEEVDVDRTFIQGVFAKKCDTTH